MLRQNIKAKQYPKIHLLNPNKIVRSEKIFFGERPPLLDWDYIPYPTLYKIYQVLQGNYWIPREITLKNDTNQWIELCKKDEGAKNAYLKSIGMIKCLDSNQSEYVYALSRLATDKAVSNMMVAVANMEVIHNESYTYIESSVIDSTERIKNLQGIINDELIEKSNALAFSLYEPMLNAMPTPSPEDLAKSLIGNSVLEGIRFVVAFATIYGIHHHYNLMGGTVNQIQYINRDLKQVS